MEHLHEVVLLEGVVVDSRDAGPLPVGPLPSVLVQYSKPFQLQLTVIRLLPQAK